MNSRKARNEMMANIIVATVFPDASAPSSTITMIHQLLIRALRLCTVDFAPSVFANLPSTKPMLLATTSTPKIVKMNSRVMADERFMNERAA